MSPSMEKERIDHQVLNSIFSGTEPDRNTLAQYQIHLAAFFGISVYKRLERCVGTHPEKLWVKIPNHFCLSAYDRIVGALANLGYTISDQTVGNILKRHGLPPAPERQTTTTWTECIRTHMDVPH